LSSTRRSPSGAAPASAGQEPPRGSATKSWTTLPLGGLWTAQQRGQRAGGSKREGGASEPVGASERAGERRPELE
ncbi:MAG: hypothetical protein ABWY33_08015, partial [Cellulomonas sp.]